MKFIADLHLHSRFSRATARDLTLESLYRWAQLKGITLVGTGDFTHPEWVAELREKLEPAAPGLYRLKPAIAERLDRDIPERCRGTVRFILQCEISNIYKKDGQVRKNHNLIYYPDLATVEVFNARMDDIGNIHSDGRPILGLDARRLLEIMLEVSDEGFLVPAHIWTPWFSLLGSKSGFDSLEACFGDLSGHIFAVETGLSSDPPMNWQVSFLDRVRLMSSSDAHSPAMLGRNASVFNTALSFFHVRKALEEGDPEKYKGTIDMFPQEGKYHNDGHRKCGVCLDPSDTRRLDGLCPECGRPLTLGVLYRVRQLADRPPGFVPEGRQGYHSIVPLTDTLSEICGVGPKTKKVTTLFHKALTLLGPELEILLERPVKEIETAGIPLLADAVSKIRSGEVEVSPGFDGEYGKVRLFNDAEKKRLKGEQEMFATPRPPKKKRKISGVAESPAPPPHAQSPPSSAGNTFSHARRAASAGQRPATPGSGSSAPEPDLLASLNPAQQKALDCHERPLLISAGPGTGKTRTITAKIAWLIRKKSVPPERILALTFTNRAAQEMKERIRRQLDEASSRVCACTFHAFCLDMLKAYAGFSGGIVDDATRLDLIRATLADMETNTDALPNVRQANEAISRSKQQGPEGGNPSPQPDGSEGGEAAAGTLPLMARIQSDYQARLDALNLVDYEDLINRVLALFLEKGDVAQALKNRFDYLFVDEYQDVNQGQYRLVRHLAGDGSRLCAIGDPDQSIYGFRGSDNRYFDQFLTDYPQALSITLDQNYRSTRAILEASCQMLSAGSRHRDAPSLISEITGRETVIIQSTATEKQEAVAVGKAIEKLVGGLSLLSMDSGYVTGYTPDGYAFSDMAVLYRTRRQGTLLAQTLEKVGIPCRWADRENTLLKAGICEVLSLLKMAQGKADFRDLALLLDLLKTGRGPKTRQQLQQWFYRRAIPFPDILKVMADAPPQGLRRDIECAVTKAGRALHDICSRLEPLETREALQAAADFQDLTSRIKADRSAADTLTRLLAMAEAHPDLSAFLDHLSLTGDTDTLETGTEKVALMTMHAAKGLEFPVVFITGCEAGLIPYHAPGQHGRENLTPEALEEERRLFYVAMTRARDLLFFTLARQRRRFGKAIKTSKSPFLYDIQERLKAHARSRMKQKPKTPVSRQLTLFEDR